MDIQRDPNVEDNGLPYEPIKFVYTQTIGSVLDKFKEIVDPYTWTYEDILEPKVMTSASKVEYYLFHIAPIYNWLRKVDSNILARYIAQPPKPGSVTPLNEPSFSTKNNKPQQYKRFELKPFLTQLKHYYSQWEVVKLSVCAKVKIITTKTDPKPVNNSKPAHKNNNPLNNNQLSLIKCTHLIKKEKFTSDYFLNTFTPSAPKLQCNKVYCDDCQESIEIKSQITKYPFAPCFLKYHGKEFVINENTSSKIIYQLVIVFATEKTYVKTSAGVWYEVSKDKNAIVSFDKIQIKSGLLFVYQQAIPSNKILRKAEPIITKQNVQKKIQQLSKDFDQNSEDSQPFKQNNQISHSKPLQMNSQKTNPSLKPQISVEQQENNPQNKEDEDDQLQDMTKNPLPVVLNKKNTDRKLFKEYKKTVEGLLPKPRQKDEYQREYDKGKTKKIHKNKQQFRTADFFKLYTDLNKKNGTSQQPNKDDTEREHLNDRKKERQNNNPSTYRQKDQEYNEVYQDRRAERRNRNGFNKFGSNNRFSKDRSRDNRPQHGNRNRNNNRNKGQHSGSQGKFGHNNNNNGGRRFNNGHGKGNSYRKE